MNLSTRPTPNNRPPIIGGRTGRFIMFLNFKMKVLKKLPLFKWEFLINLKAFSFFKIHYIYIHLFAKFWLGHNKTITKTTQLSIITLAKANLNMSCFLVKIYSLPIQLQFLDQKINN